MWIVKPRSSLILRSTKSTQADEGEFESVFDVDSIKYQMVIELVQVNWVVILDIKLFRNSVFYD